MNADAGKLLMLLAFLNPDGLLLQFLKRGAKGIGSDLKGIVDNPERLFEALGALERFSLIRRQDSGLGGQKIVMHRLVQCVVKDEMPPKVFEDFLKEVVALFNCAFPAWHDWDPDLLARSRIYEDQVVGTLLEIKNMPSTILGDVLSRVGLYLREDGKPEQAISILSKTVDVFILAKGKEDSDTLSAIALLAWCYQTEGRFEKAAALEERVLEARNRLFGPDHLETLEAMVNLANTYRSLGRYKEAGNLKEVVLEVRTRILGPNTRTRYLQWGFWQTPIEIKESGINLYNSRRGSSLRGCCHPEGNTRVLLWQWET
jgi:tetratricopeptide (TPR) repeat protein